MATTVGNVIFQISADLKNVQGQLRTLESNFQSSFSKISGIASSAFGAIGLSLSTAAIVGFVKTSVSEIGKLQDVFERTGISADILLKLKPILENTGSSVEEFANSVNAMQKSLVDGSADTIAAFQKVGIAAGEILKLAEDPEELLDRVAKGLANVATQTERVAIARELASRAGARIAPALLELAKGGGLDTVRGQKSIISKEEIAAIDEAGDALNTFKIKAQAVAALSFVQVLQGFKDLVQYIQEHPIRFIFNLDGSALEIIGKARQLREDVAKATVGSQLGGAGKLGLVEGTAPGLKETNAQRDFKKALDEQIDGLKSQVLALTSSKEAAIANAAEIIKTKAATIGLTESSEELTKRLNEFKAQSLAIAQGQLAEQITKQNQNLEVQIAAMTDGKAAAEQLALKYSLLDAKLQDIGPAAQAAAEKQRQLNDAQAQAFVPQTKRELGEDIETARAKQVTLGITFNADEAIRTAIESAIDKLVSNPDPRVKKLALEAALELKPQLDASRLKSIQTELGLSLGLDKEFSQVLNQTFTNTFDVAANKVQALEKALGDARQRGVDPLNEGVQEIGRRLDAARFEQSASELAKDFQIASTQAEVFGRSFDLGSANIQAIETQLNRLATGGLKSSNEQMQQLAAALRDAKVSDVFSDLGKDLETAAREAEVLGGAVDLPADAIDRLTDAIKRLIAEGIDPLDPKLQGLKAQLEDAKAAEHFADAFQGIARSGLDALTDLADGAKIKDVAKRLASNINRAITDALITKPFEDWIRKQTNELFGGVLKLPIPGAAAAGQSVGIPGAVGQAAGAAGQTQSAVAATQIQAVATTSTAGIQSTVAVAQTAITTLGTTTEASISALQAVAIAAIQAAAAGQGASSALGGAANIGSLFSGGTAAASTAAGSEFAAVGADEIFSLFPAVLHKGGLIDATLPIVRFHDGGIMGGGKIMAQPGAAQELKPGERMIIAEDGEVVFSKEAVRAIGEQRLLKANDEKKLWPKYHDGGMVHPEIRYAVNVERYHDGGSVSLAEGWSSPVSDFAMVAAAMPQTATMATPGRSDGQGSAGSSVNVANFYNPQFQNRQSVGQTSAQLTAAMEAGKRNR